MLKYSLKTLFCFTLFCGIALFTSKWILQDSATYWSSGLRDYSVIQSASIDLMNDNGSPHSCQIKQKDAIELVKLFEKCPKTPPFQGMAPVILPHMGVVNLQIAKNEDIVLHIGAGGEWLWSDNGPFENHGPFEMEHQRKRILRLIAPTGASNK